MQKSLLARQGKTEGVLTGLPLGPSSPGGPLGPGGPAAPEGPASPFSPLSPLGPCKGQKNFYCQGKKLQNILISNYPLINSEQKKLYLCLQTQGHDLTVPSHKD